MSMQFPALVSLALLPCVHAGAMIGSHPLVVLREGPVVGQFHLLRCDTCVGQSDVRLHPRCTSASPIAVFNVLSPQFELTSEVVRIIGHDELSDVGHIIIHWGYIWRDGNILSFFKRGFLWVVKQF